MSSYTVISDFIVCEKTKGQFLTEKELLSAGVNIPALIEAGHIAPVEEKAPDKKSEGE